MSAEVYNAEAESASWVPPVIQKSRFVEEWLISILQPHILFKHLDDRELKSVMNAMTPMLLRGGAIIYSEGRNGLC